MMHGQEARTETATASIIKCVEIQIILFNVIAQLPNTCTLSIDGQYA